MRNKILAEASQQKSLKLVVALTPGGNLQTWLCRKKHWLEYQKHSKHNNLRKGSDRGMFSQCELKPGAERRQFHPVNPWDDPPLELAIALILLQPTSFNTLNWWKYTFLWPGLVGWWIKSAWPDHHLAACCRAEARAHHSQPLPLSREHRAGQHPPSVLPNPSRGTRIQLSYGVVSGQRQVLNC